MASEAGRRAEPANTPLVEQARLLATRDPRYGACVGSPLALLGERRDAVGAVRFLVDVAGE